VRDHHLRVCLGSQSARLKERLLIPDTACVNVETSLDIIDCIDHKVEALPELIVEDVFGLLCHIQLVILHIQVIVNVMCDLACHSALRITDIVFAEEELSVQVRNFNVIIISDSDLSFGRATDTHKSECLDVLASEGASTDHESIDFGQFFLDFTPVNKDLVVVSAVHWGAISGATRESLENVVV
jgi:hypothetical protein